MALQYVEGDCVQIICYVFYNVYTVSTTTMSLINIEQSICITMKEHVRITFIKIIQQQYLVGLHFSTFWNVAHPIELLNNTIL